MKKLNLVAMVVRFAAPGEGKVKRFAGFGAFRQLRRRQRAAVGKLRKWSRGKGKRRTRYYSSSRMI